MLDRSRCALFFVLGMLDSSSVRRARLTSLPLHSKTIGVAMSSPIGFREFDEDDYRKFIRTLSDEELVKVGKRLRILCGDVVIPTPST